jgi:thiol:disulfide interchange protein DsbD
MDGVKSVFGVLLLVAAAYYLSAWLRPLEALRVRETWVVGLGAGLAVAGVLLGAVHLSFHERRFWVVTRKLLGVVALTAGLFMSLQYVRGSNLRLQYKDIDKALTAAKKSKKPVLMDFWATWCEKCIELEKETLAHPTVAKELKQRFITVKVDCTPKTDKVKQTKKRWKVKGLPTLVLLDSQQRHVKNIVGKVSPKELLRELKKIE